MVRIRRLTQALHAQARSDALTRVGNRRAFNEALDRRCAEAARYDRPLALLLSDADHFKRVNDTYGHDTGDDVLRLMSQAIVDSVRTSDRTFRYGGEEFAVLAPGTRRGGAIILAERLRTAFREASRDSVAGVQTLSVGVAVIEGTKALAPRHVIRMADHALYRAKSRGRNRVCAFDRVRREQDYSTLPPPQ